jgi:xanthine dehydrogenase accessory factor
MNRPPPRLDTSLELLLAERPEREGEAVLATVVGTHGSTYRKAGARMLLYPNGRRVGLLSGGCLEADLAEHARAVLALAVPRAITYDQRAEDEVYGIGGGCEGAMRILLEPVGPAAPAAAALDALARASRAGEEAVLAVIHAGPDALLGSRGPAALPDELAPALAGALRSRGSLPVEVSVAGAAISAYVDYLAPPVHLLVLGAGPDAEPVARTAVGLGWQVTLLDHRPAYARAERFPGARVSLLPLDAPALAVAIRGADAVIVMSHRLEADQAYLAQLAVSGPAYVGLLGPRARRDRLLREVAGGGLDGRLRGPVGLDLGAVTPEAIALAIVAEIHAVLAGRSARPYSERAP